MLKTLSGPWRLLAIVTAMLLAAAVFSVPYHVPVAPTVSQSYVCGFNNRAALVLFVASGLLFAIGIGGLRVPSPGRVQDPGRMRYAGQDAPLSPWVLLVGLLATLGVCVMLRVNHAAQNSLGVEAYYLLNRQTQMVEGLRLYRDLEFVYGPLLIYPGYWLQTGLHWSPLRAYMTELTVEWMTGTAMLWCLLGWVHVSTRMRLTLFAVFCFYLLRPEGSEGVQYTGMRLLCASFLSVAVATYWRRTHAPYRCALLMVGAIAVGFAVSPEQGIGLGVGLSLYALLMAWRNREHFPLGAGLLVPLGALLVVAVFGHLGELRSMQAFAQGGDNFPLLPSEVNLFVLCTYLGALAVLYRLLLEGEWDNPLLPLGLCGVPMLTSAFGRCDAGHLTSTTALLLVAMCWLAGRRWTMAAWLVLACYFLFDFGSTLAVMSRVVHRVRHASAASPLVARVGIVTVQPKERPTGAQRTIPNDRVFFAPFGVPMDEHGLTKWHAQSGYYFGVDSVLTPKDFAAVAGEIRDRRAPFLLLPDAPNGAVLTFWTSETDINLVAYLEGSLWAPKPKRPLPSTEVIRDAVERLYEPTDTREEGWRVWKLRS